MSDIRFLGLTLAGHSRNTARLPIRPLKKEPTEHHLIFVPKDGANSYTRKVSKREPKVDSPAL